MEWYEDYLIRVMDKFSAPYEGEINSSKKFSLLKNEYIKALNEVNSKNSLYHKIIDQTICELENICEILESFFYLGRKGKGAQLTKHIFNDIQEYHSTNDFYRIVRGDEESYKFFRDDDLYRKPTALVAKIGRYNDIKEATMYLSEQALLCWQECQRPTFFTVAKFQEKMEATPYRYFCVKSAKQIYNDYALCCPPTEEICKIVQHYLTLVPLFLILSQSGDNDSKYFYSNLFFSWIKESAIADGIAYCNCAKFYDGRQYDGQRILYSKTNIAISTQYKNLEDIKSHFELVGATDFCIKQQLLKTNDEIEQVNLVRKMFCDKNIFL